MAVKPIPDGYHSVTPYLIVKGAAQALEFYKNAFGAEEMFRMDGPGGCIMHAEFKAGDSILMIADEMPEMGHKGPQTLGGSPVSLLLYVKDCDAIFARALAAGAKQVRPLANQFYGDRSGVLTDPYGHIWNIATHVEDLTPDEIGKRAAEMMKNPGGCC